MEANKCIPVFSTDGKQRTYGKDSWTERITACAATVFLLEDQIMVLPVMLVLMLALPQHSVREPYLEDAVGFQMLPGQRAELLGKKQAGTRRRHRWRRVNHDDVKFFRGAFEVASAVVNDDVPVGIIDEACAASA